MRLLILFTLSVLPFIGFSQEIRGQVIDTQADPVEGAYIIHIQSEHHAHSNKNGEFSLSGLQIGDTLQVMHIAYETFFHTIEEKDFNKGVSVQLKDAIFDLDEIVVGQNIKKTNIIAAIDIQTSPVNSSQEVLRKVPGLFIGQHAGGGKAEQIFLRGFDIDHGTDVQISIDNMPVNMVSHAHGQGYADLHFIIPETIEKLDYGKGPYFANKGNFSTAGYVAFKTKDQVENSQFGLEYGQFNTLRASSQFKLLETDHQHAYVATEYMISDGAFESPQNFSRNNIMAKYTADVNDVDKVSILASHFSSTWDASGQIPQRAVDQGLITRFGAIDDTEGGQTSRTNIIFNFNKVVDDFTFIKNTVFYSQYDFELYSNFTFFLDNPINGDQIRQKESRQLLGFESVWNQTLKTNRANTFLQLGVGLRSDQITDNELSSTMNREITLESIQLGDVDEKNLYSFANIDFDYGNWLFQPSVRVDYFKFNYVNHLDSIFDRKSASTALVSPKFNVVYNLNNNAQLFFKTGMGFHSNDSRVVLEEANTVALPAAYGADLGGIFKPRKRMIANIALWYLFLEQEFVYVGDAGVVEPSGKTERVGIDIGMRYQAKDWLFINADVNYASAKSVDEPEDSNRIPLAPVVTATGGLTFKNKNLQGGLQVRYLQDRPANEDNSIIAKGYMITDLNATYQFKKVSIGFAIENLFDQEWNETQFATESRLAFEPSSVEEIHFTPGSPFFIKGMVKYQF